MGGMATGQADERAQLLEQIVEVQNVFETSSLRSFLEPLMTLDLTIQQLRVLAILVAEGGATTGQGLSKMLAVYLATVSGIVDRLEAHGMLQRVPDPSDQRVRRILATPRGRKTVQHLLTAQSRFNPEPLGSLEIDDLRALARGLRAVARVSASQEHRPD